MENEWAFKITNIVNHSPAISRERLEPSASNLCYAFDVFAEQMNKAGSTFAGSIVLHLLDEETGRSYEAIVSATGKEIFLTIPKEKLEEEPFYAPS